MDDTSQLQDKIPEIIREDLITTAVKFLQHPSVQKSSVEQRQSFLRKKGLSDKEISVAFERSSSGLPPVSQFPHQQTNASQYTALSMPMYSLPVTRWGRFREIVTNFAIVGGIIYGLYVLYKKYISPFLFGCHKKKTALEESIETLEASVKSSVQELRMDLQKVQTDVEKISEQQELSRNHATAKQMQEIKNEIISLKGLLVNRKQFTSVALEHPSIPAWQLEAEQASEQKGGDEESSASAGSEVEVVTTNGSDSSLEMIKQ